MDNKDFLKNVYEDFFGIQKIEKENQKLREELNIKDNFPSIEVKKISENKELSKEEKDSKMMKWFEEIDKLYVNDESKDTLKKMIEYSRKYSEGIEKEYISFNMCIYSDDNETTNQIIEIISKSTIYFSYIKKEDNVKISLYSLEKLEDLKNYYEKNSIIIFKDFEGLISKEQLFKDKFACMLEEKILDKKDSLTILVTANKDKIRDTFEKNESIREKTFSFEIFGTKPETQDVYNEILNKLKETSKVSEDFEISLLDYIVATYPKTEMSFPEYRDKFCQRILFHKKEEITSKDIPEYEKDKSMDEIFEELNNLVGLSKVKQVVKDLADLIELREKTKDSLKIKNTNLHMVFLGNPGTGKTTVARIIVGILYNLKYIKQNKLIEVSSKDLVAEYVGQTAPKTMSVIEKAMDGVLFIDEAYSLASGNGHGNSYNEEAIATLIQAMENYRDRLVVIFAGYTKEMQAFLNSNSGIVSRIGYTLEFDDYTEDELIEIFNGMIKKAGFGITNEAIEEKKRIIMERKGIKNFGNARFVRNLYEKAIIKHASNTKGKKSKKLLKTIQKEDINAENI